MTQQSIRTICVSGIVFECIAGRHLTVLPLHKTNRIEAGHLFCFECYEFCEDDSPPEFIYAIARSVGEYRVHPRASVSVEYDLVHFKLLRDVHSVVLG